MRIPAKTLLAAGAIFAAISAAAGASGVIGDANILQADRASSDAVKPGAAHPARSATDLYARAALAIFTAQEIAALRGEPVRDVGASATFGIKPTPSKASLIHLAASGLALLAVALCFMATPRFHRGVPTPFLPEAPISSESFRLAGEPARRRSQENLDG